MLADLLAPEVMRVVIPVVLLIGYVGYHAWRWRMLHPTDNAEEPTTWAVAGTEPAKAGENKADGQWVEVEGEGQDRNGQLGDTKTKGTEENAQPSSPAPGEAEYSTARGMLHQKIPDFGIDGLYLDLLGESADKGYAPALALLGEYAMRREAWVEAYYWMWRAQRCGMTDREAVLRGIRQSWILAGYPSEVENIHDLFNEERGSIGRALIGIAASHDAATARKFLANHHPEFL